MKIEVTFQRREMLFVLDDQDGRCDVTRKPEV